ncbi:hypothetical protein SESBI_49567 [Sesbania bispinosa]|nr:hypothetical protein SESBI_49567 [Sesbania bispinosa]
MSESNPGSNPVVFFCPITGPPYPTHLPSQQAETRHLTQPNYHAPITGRPVMLHYSVHSPTSSFDHNAPACVNNNVLMVESSSAVMNNSKKYDFDNDIIFLGPPNNMILEYKCSMSLGQVCMLLKIGQPIYRSRPVMKIEGVDYYAFRASLIGKLHGIHHSAVGAYAPSEDLAREDSARKLLT